MSDSLSIGITGLLAAMRGMNVTGNNIANVNTEGYSRQRTEQISQLPQFSGGQYYGNGTEIATVRRIYDELLARQVRSSQSASSELEVFQREGSRVSEVIANPDLGIDGAAQNFFDAWQGVANDPGSIGFRQVLLDQSQSMVDRFHDLSRVLGTLNQDANSSLTTVTGDINGLARSVARINKDISDAYANGVGNAPNDLLDQRDHLLDQLSQYVDIQTYEDDNHLTNVFIGKGQSLVLGLQAGTLQTASSQFDPSQLDIQYVSPDGKTEILVTEQMSGGELAGYLRLRDEILEPAKNSLGRLAVALSSDVNAQHQLGLDLTNTAGGSFFNDLTQISSRVFPSSNNLGDADFSVRIADPSQLIASDYEVKYDSTAGQYIVTRLSDNTEVGRVSPPAPGAVLATVDGIELTLNSGTAQNQDRFLVQPTRLAADYLELKIDNVRHVAAASQMQVVDASGNTGTARMSVPALEHINRHPVGGGFTLTYDSANSRFNLTGPVDASGNTISISPAQLAFDPATDSGGRQYTLRLGTAPDTFDLRFEISGTPANGDSFQLVQNTDGGRSDNRNALAMVSLQGLKRLEGRISYQDANNELVSDVASRTRYAEANYKAYSGMLQLNQSRQQEVMGVNLDEEAARLMKFQQAYQASAKVIDIARSTFDTLLSSLG